MTATTVGLLALAVSVMVSRKLGLDFRCCRQSAVTALAMFLASLILEGLVVVVQDPSFVTIASWLTVVGWLMLMFALVRASGALRRETEGETDVEMAEYLAFREERQRARMRQRLESQED